MTMILMVEEKKTECEYFLTRSKKCSIRTEMEGPPGPCMDCVLVAPHDSKLCPAKKYYADPGPYVNDVPISLSAFLMTTTRCSSFGKANTSDACSQCPDNEQCAKVTK
jgi:hypothetical protein